MRDDLPRGTVTFVFTDVAGSTRLLQEHGDAYAGLLAAHRTSYAYERERRDSNPRPSGVTVVGGASRLVAASHEATAAVQTGESTRA
jgi:hypothetical protein